MSNYIKPTAILLAAGGLAGTHGSCTSTSDDLEILKEVFEIADLEKAFSANEACEEIHDINGYCKFTAADDGAVKVFIS